MGKHMLERELKLHVPPGRRGALESELRELGAADIELAARYFDTPDGRLAQAGIALRLRLEGKQWVQTIKAPGPDELSRVEINHPRPKPELDLELYDNTSMAPFFAGLAHAPEQLYETRVQRLVLRQDTGDGAIEFAYDQGVIIAGRFELPLCELELELISGNADQLFTVGAEWLEKYGLILDLRSKAERGNGLARLAGTAAGQDGTGRRTDFPAMQAHQLFSPRRAGAIALEAGMSLAQVYLRCINECMNHIVRNATLLAGTESQYVSPELSAGYVHQLRVGIRRLRSCWKFFGTWLPVRDSVLESELRRYFSLLGQARDADIIRLHIEPRLMDAGMPALAPPSRPEGTGADMDHAGMRTMAASAAFQSCLLTLLEHTVVTISPAPQARPKADSAEHARAGDTAQALRKRLNKWLNRLCTEGEHFSRLPATEQHRLRKKTKRLRYCLEFSASLLERKRTRRVQRALAAVQEELGRLNDLYLAQSHYTPQAALQPQALFALGWLQAMQEQAQTRAETTFKKLTNAGRLKKKKASAR